MAKINHNNYLNTITELIRDADKKGILHLTSEANDFSGRNLRINGAEMINFGTCGYLALENDERLKKRVIEYVNQFGTQFSVSRTYISSEPNIALEDLLSQIYDGNRIIVSASTSSAHISNIPSLVNDTDLIILDHQVHMSVQTGVQLARVKGTQVEMIRHSNLDMLEEKIKELGSKYAKIWYMADGVYSMYGDLAPIQDLIALANKYDKFYLYVDDAHGMSWYGKHGAGYIYETVGMHDKMVLVTTLAKGFGVNGGITIFPNQGLFDKVYLFGGPLTYSHPIAPPLIGAAIASAEIHLSDEIYSLQADLEKKINYCNSLLSETNLPVISSSLTPIYFIGAGQPKVGYNIVKRLMNEGFFVNLALFPAVPVKNTGIRFTLTRHIMEQDIKGLVDAINYHFPLALEDAGKTLEDVEKLFYLFQPKKNDQQKKMPSDSKTQDFYVQHETDIENINSQEWDSLLGQNGAFDSNSLKFMQKSFSGNEKPEDNWDFHYYIIHDLDKKPVLATFFTVGIYKDDMLSPYGISINIENKRKSDPYYLTSKTIGMGSLMTEGIHLYIDRNNSKWKEAFKMLEEELSMLSDVCGASNIMLRDFDAYDSEFRDFMIEEGFFKIDMPNTNVIKGMVWNTYDEFLETLSGKNRRRVRNDVLKNEFYFDIEIKDSLTPEEIAIFEQLYLNIKSRNFSINTFPYPTKMFRYLSETPNYEFIILRLKSEYSSNYESRIVSIGSCYKGMKYFTMFLLGMDYEFVFTHGVYRQTLFQALKRAREIGYENVYVGLSADIEKNKLGARQYPRVSYVQAKDNFNFELLEAISSATELV